MNQNLYNNKGDVESEIYREARRRVDEKKKFYKHLYTFLIFNSIFLVMSFFRGRPFAPLTVTFFWGAGLIFHYLKVFGLPGSGILSREWEDKEVRKEINNLKKTRRGDLRDDEPLELKELRKNYDESDLV
jgi:hypothetical protein